MRRFTSILAGRPHLIDPSRLIDSATRIYGDEMERLWGKFAPIAEQSVTVLQDMDIVRLGPLRSARDRDAGTRQSSPYLSLGR